VAHGNCAVHSEGVMTAEEFVVRLEHLIGAGEHEWQ
jgi:hypothetical protein